jgi:outer membrane receptor protein involved in Fe transport
VAWAWVLALAAWVPAARAQASGSITGQVRSAITGEPLAGVAVRVGESSIRAVTREDGRFVLNGVAAGELRLSLELLPDYATAVEVVTVPAGEVVRLSLELVPEAVLLDEILVRGKAGDSSITAKSFTPEGVLALVGNGSAVDLLARGFPGVDIRRGSGRVGTGPAIMIRGSGSLSLPGDPLVFLDGIQVGGSPGWNTRSSGEALRVLDMVPAGSVQRIEVLRGPAAVRYGLGANNGVILVWTRR